MQRPKTEATSYPPPGGTLVSGASVGKADLQIFHTKSRKRSDALHLSARGKRCSKPPQLEAEEKPGCTSTLSVAALPDEESFMCHVHKEETPQVTPRKEAKAEKSKMITTMTVLPFGSFEEAPPSEDACPLALPLQKASIVIDPRENVQTTIILDDSSSITTSLPFVT